MSWVEYLTNSKPITSVFKNAPSLDRVKLIEIVLLEDGPRALLRLDIPDYPDDPPIKWVQSQFNTVQLTLMLIDVTDVRIFGWSRNNIVALSFARTTVGIAVSAKGTGVELECVCKFLDVDKISAYCNSERASV